MPTPTYELISETTATGTSTVTLSSLPTTYRHLEVFIDSASASNADAGFKFRINGITTQTYSYWYHNIYDGNTNGSWGNSASSWEVNFATNAQRTDRRSVYRLVFPDYRESGIRKSILWTWATGGYAAGRGSGDNSTTSAITSITIFQESSSGFSDMTIRLYGITG